VFTCESQDLTMQTLSSLMVTFFLVLKLPPIFHLDSVFFLFYTLPIKK
jgi:hypothetical protein